SAPRARQSLPPSTPALAMAHWLAGRGCRAMGVQPRSGGRRSPRVCEACCRRVYSASPSHARPPKRAWLYFGGHRRALADFYRMSRRDPAGAAFISSCLNRAAALGLEVTAAQVEVAVRRGIAIDAPA